MDIKLGEKKVEISFEKENEEWGEKQGGKKRRWGRGRLIIIRVENERTTRRSRDRGKERMERE